MSVSIIIPVYNAFNAAKACLDSVIRHTESVNRIIVIDDASSEGTFEESLPRTVRTRSNVSIVRNEANLGFGESCNKGIFELSNDDDVVLLNSDTIVTSRWVEKLRTAAYAQPRVGTVTPLTNNGTICSIPHFMENNHVPLGLSIEEFAGLVDRVSARVYISIPTCVGFCSYMRRELLDAVGGFDSAFGKGYGEENDLSYRGRQAGFVNIVDDATFVFHQGGLSFQDSRGALSEKNARILLSRHPSYDSDVQSFIKRNPLRDIHSRVRDGVCEEWIRRGSGMILHLLEDDTTVTRLYPFMTRPIDILEVIRGTSEFCHWSMRREGAGAWLTAHIPGSEYSAFIESFDNLLDTLLSMSFLDVLHLHYSLGEHKEILRALQQHGNYVVASDDLSLSAPRVLREVGILAKEFPLRTSRESNAELYTQLYRKLVDISPKKSVGRSRGPNAIESMKLRIFDSLATSYQARGEGISSAEIG